MHRPDFSRASLHIPARQVEDQHPFSHAVGGSQEGGGLGQRGDRLLPPALSLLLTLLLPTHAMDHRATARRVFAAGGGLVVSRG